MSAESSGSGKPGSSSGEMGSTPGKNYRILLAAYIYELISRLQGFIASQLAKKNIKKVYILSVRED